MKWKKLLNELYNYFMFTPDINLKTAKEITNIFYENFREKEQSKYKYYFTALQIIDNKQLTLKTTLKEIQKRHLKTKSGEPK